MSQCYVALLRGINVGRAKRVAMADLRQIVEGLGYANVRSLLNSGNVVFHADATAAAAAAAAIEEALVLKLGVASRVIVLDSDELAAIVAANPLLDVADNHSRLMVFVLGDPAQRARLEALAEQDWGCEQLALGERAAYIWCPEGVLDSAPALALGKQLGDGTTSRNWNTLMKLHAMCSAI